MSSRGRWRVRAPESRASARENEDRRTTWRGSSRMAAVPCRLSYEKKSEWKGYDESRASSSAASLRNWSSKLEPVVSNVRQSVEAEHRRAAEEKEKCKAFLNRWEERLDNQDRTGMMSRIQLLDKELEIRTQQIEEDQRRIMLQIERLEQIYKDLDVPLEELVLPPGVTDAETREQFRALLAKNDSVLPNRDHKAAHQIALP